MSAPSDERRLWLSGAFSCVMVSCCSGAELQVRQAVAGDASSDFSIVLRELYPMKSDLYERARELEAEYAAQRVR